MSSADEAADFSTTFARGLSVIRCFSKQAPSLTVSEAAALADMSRAAARRFLHTLVALGYASFDGRRFQLTAKVLDLGYAYLCSFDLWEVAQPFIERLSHEVHESCGASVLEGTDVVHIIHVAPKRIMPVFVSAGTRQPAHATALGRIHLAALDHDAFEAYLKSAELRAFTPRTITTAGRLRKAVGEARRLGYAFVDQELEEGLRAIAVPLRDKSGRVLAALVISCHAARVTKDEMVSRLLPRLQATADAISAALPSALAGRTVGARQDPLVRAISPT